MKIPFQITSLDPATPGSAPANRGQVAGRDENCPQHSEIYAIAAHFAAGRDVLIAPCDDAAGTAVLGRVARRVIGLNTDPLVIATGAWDHASAKLCLAVAAAHAVPLADGMMDVVLNPAVCLQATARNEAMIAEVVRVLRPDGLLLLSVVQPPLADQPLDEPWDGPLLAALRPHFAEIHSVPPGEALRGCPREAASNSNAHLGFIMASNAALPAWPRDLRWEPSLLAEPGAARDSSAVADHEVYLRRIHVIPLWREFGLRDNQIRQLRESLAEQTACVLDLTAAAARTQASLGVRLDAALRRNRLSNLLLRAARLTWWMLSGQRKSRQRERRDAREILASGAFDGSWYTRTHAEVAGCGIDPVLHFLRQGAPLGLDPSPTFSITAYRHRHPGLGRDGNPLLDAIRQGKLADGEPLIASPPAPQLSLGGLDFSPLRPPEIAVVLDVRDGLETLRQCLTVLAADQDSAALEVVILVAPGTEIAVRGALTRVAAREDTGAVAQAVAGCRAACIIVPHPGVVPLPGAIHAMGAAFRSIPAAGMLCGKLLGPDRIVVQAGGTFAAHAALEPRGAGVAADHFSIASLIGVDLAPPGLVGFDATWLRRVGGLPAGAERSWGQAAELALRIRSQGGTVMYQPHAEAMMLHQLPSPPTGGGRALALRYVAGVIARQARPRALFVDHLTPKPDQDSGSGDIYWLMRIMLDLGYDVTFLPMYDLSPAGVYTDALRELGITCVTSPDVPSPEVFLQEQGATFDVAFLHRWAIAERCLDILREKAPDLRIVFNTVDLHHLREQREAEFLGSAAAMAKAQETRARELAVMQQADMTILLSEAEQLLMAAELPTTPTRRIPIVRSVPLHQARPAGRDGVVFVGGFAHPPNIDAITRFVAETWPLVRQRMPGVRLRVVGSQAPAEIFALANAAAGIEVMGYVADLSDLLSRSRLTVAPLRYGAGIKGKVVTSLLHGVPCVASPMAAEGMGLIDGRDILVAHSPEEFAAAIARLHADDALWDSLSQAGTTFAREHFSVERVAVAVRDLLTDLELPAMTDLTEPADVASGH